MIDENETKGKFHEFLQSVQKNGAQSRTFQDVEVNEGRWLLEATGNYNWQSHLDGIPTTKLIELQVEITNTVSSGILKMVGSSMTSAYNQIVANAQSQVSGQSKHLAALDIDIVGITETKTVLMTRVAITSTVFDGACNSLDHFAPHIWPFQSAANDIIAVCAHDMLPVYGEIMGAFYPDVKIVLPMDRQCTTTTPIKCLYSDEFDTFSTPPTEYDWFRNQAQTAVIIMDNIEHEYFGVPAPNPAPIKSSMFILHTNMTNPWFNFFAVHSVTFKVGPVYYW